MTSFAQHLLALGLLSSALAHTPPARPPTDARTPMLVRMKPLPCDAAQPIPFPNGFPLDRPACQKALATRLRDLSRLGIGPVTVLKLAQVLAVSLSSSQRAELERLDWVRAVEPDLPLYLLPSSPSHLPLQRPSPPLPSRQESDQRWNLTMVEAPAVWQQGVTGAGAVVASLDSGVDKAHTALSAGFRGGPNDWKDLFGTYAQPADEDGHGTQSLALAVGADLNGSPLGVAPEAQWIAVRMFQKGVSSLSLAHQALEWAFDPDGNPNTADQPDVVLASWWLEGSTNSCLTEFSADLAAFEAANIPVVFAAGNTGPNTSTSAAPANDPAAWSVGAVDSAQAVGSFSARGPSACGGGIYPLLVAPGTSVETADLTFGVFPSATILVTGTSFAAPAVAGAIALLRSDEPDATTSDLQAALVGTAVDVGPAGDDMQTGYGLLNVYAAWQSLSVTPNQPPVAQADASEVHRAQASTLPVLNNDRDPEGALDAMSLRIETLPLQGTAVLLPDGTLQYTSYRLARGQDSFTYSVADRQGLRSPPAKVSLKILPR